ncbi:hypothetical protein DFQ29_000273 [Apophysomyces sp. BC1021]|nr:hypothetical protein DFQ29_000273 [Apophysomyces sp. BC1021]
MDAKLASRLEVLADNTLSIVFERNRSKELGLNYDKHEASIQKKLTQLHEGIKTLEGQLSSEEQRGTSDTKSNEDKLIHLQVKVDKLDALLADKDNDSAREILLGNTTKTVRFRPADVDPSDLESGQLVQLQQRIMEDVDIAYIFLLGKDQDNNLDQLSDVIRRQRELGLVIGDELEAHAQLIDETDALADRTDAKLRQARKRLTYVGRKVKDNKSVCIVIALILIFFILLALFR